MKKSKEPLIEVKSASPQSARSKKVSKKGTMKAVILPRTDLAYHGVLEDLQGYDPRPRSRTAGIAHPQAADLAQDHFRELDRNLDGRVDSLERAVGRLDIERDLQNGQP